MPRSLNLSSDNVWRIIFTVMLAVSLAVNAWALRMERRVTTNEVSMTFMTETLDDLLAELKGLRGEVQAIRRIAEAAKRERGK